MYQINMENQVYYVHFQVISVRLYIHMDEMLIIKSVVTKRSIFSIIEVEFLLIV